MKSRMYVLIKLLINKLLNILIDSCLCIGLVFIKFDNIEKLFTLLQKYIQIHYNINIIYLSCQVEYKYKHYQKQVTNSAKNLVTI